MSGIAGKISSGGRVEEPLLKSMVSTLRHRGPDGEGIHIDNSGIFYAGLAHAGLNTIGFNRCRQPISNEDGALWMVFDGEIYNFTELREGLLKRGHIFRAKGRVEALLHLYEEKGPAMVEDLRGAFAFAIWDGKNKRLFAARDRVGQKPFNFYYGMGNFIFGSEIKAILKDPAVKREINLSSMDFYLTYGYTPLDSSIFTGISKLLPAHYLILDKSGLKIKKYWELKYDKPQKSKRIEEYEECLLDILRESVRLRLASDVPLGAFLSGGIDSSLVVALMGQISGSGIKTFTVGFEHGDYSELKYAGKVSEILGTEHREFIIKPDAVKGLEKLVWYYNEPFADSSSIATYYVAKKTAEYVKIALNGDGGDESFAGYDRYKGICLSEFLNGFHARRIFGMGARVFSRLGRFYKGKRADFLTRRRDFLYAMYKYKDFSEKYEHWMSNFTGNDKNRLYTDDFKNTVSGFKATDFISRTIKGAGVSNPAEKAMKTDIETNLPGDLTVKMDIATMANSLEARSPFLDHKLMEFAASIPAELKLKGFTSKYIIKRLALKFLPKDILKRRKMGFGLPLRAWLKNELKEYVCGVLLDKKALGRGYFKEGGVKRLINEHMSGTKDNKAKLWSLLNLELWHKNFVD